MNLQHFLQAAIFSIVLVSCNNGPKVIKAQSIESSSETNSGIFSGDSDSEQNKDNFRSFSEDLHTVVVNEVLQASRYVYLKVTEANKQFWIATGKKEILVGDTYYYKRGLLKTNFESKEHARVFDTIYLVTSLVSKNHGDNSNSLTEIESAQETETNSKEIIPTHTEEVIEHAGSIKIADIVANPKDYQGKTVQISGKCVKVNPGIMDRNWIHLQDGSKNDYDLVVTSNTFVAEGTVVTMRAKVSLDRDFGSGYKFALILEDGTVVE
jgi:hypothetical protein